MDDKGKAGDRDRIWSTYIVWVSEKINKNIKKKYRLQLIYFKVTPELHA